MAFRKKGSRLISVNGQRFRWLVSPNDGWMEVVVELADSPCQKLVATASYNDIRTRFWLEFPKLEGFHVRQQTVVSPKIVRTIIERGFQTGWKPRERGEVLKISAEDLTPLMKASAQ